MDIEAIVDRLAAAAKLAGLDRRESLESVLRGHAIELWSNAWGQLFIVADEVDARRLGFPRGSIYIASEVHHVITLADPDIVAEVHRWKHDFDATLATADVPRTSSSTRER